jgi:glutamate synthase domain-containing protein 3
VGPRGGAAVVGPYGGTAVRGPGGNVYVGRPVGERVAVLPDSATAVAVGDQMYYVDGSGVYYLPCEDDSTVFCIVPAPQ